MNYKEIQKRMIGSEYCFTYQLSNVGWFIVWENGKLEGPTSKTDLDAYMKNANAKDVLCGFEIFDQFERYLKEVKR